MLIMSNVRINVEDYTECGLGDIYYGLISFIARHIEMNYSPRECFENGDSKYAIALVTMKSALKELLDYLKSTEEVYLPALNRSVSLSILTVQEQVALEERCKEYLILRLAHVLKPTLEETVSSKQR